MGTIDVLVLECFVNILLVLDALRLINTLAIVKMRPHDARLQCRNRFFTNFAPVQSICAVWYLIYQYVYMHYRLINCWCCTVHWWEVLAAFSLDARWTVYPAREIISTEPSSGQSVSLLCKIASLTTETFYHWCFGFYQRPSSEEACPVLLPFFATVMMQRGKKSFVYVAYCVAAFIPVHRTPSLLPDVYHILDPSDTSVRLPN